MNNSRSSGNMPVLTAPYDRLSGQLAKIGLLIVAATQDVLSGARIPWLTYGEIENVPKLSTDVVTEGAPLYWDDTNKRLTLTATSNTFCGHALAAAGNGVAVVTFRLINASKATG